MNEHDCDQVLLSAMALADGETPLLSKDAVESHVQGCESCLRELAADAALATTFRSAKRKASDETLWPSVAPRLRAGRGRIRLAGALGAAALVACVLRGGFLAWWPMLGFVGSTATIAVVAAAFWLIRENPFALPSPDN